MKDFSNTLELQAKLNRVQRELDISIFAFSFDTNGPAHLLACLYFLFVLKDCNLSSI